MKKKRYNSILASNFYFEGTTLGVYIQKAEGMAKAPPCHPFPTGLVWDVIVSWIVLLENVLRKRQLFGQMFEMK